MAKRLKKRQMRKYSKIPTLDINSSAILPELLNLMSKVDLNSQEAKLNVTSMSDNNGGRILL